MGLNESEGNSCINEKLKQKLYSYEFKQSINMAKKPRTQIPKEISAEILVRSDRTCCVCREKHKPIQIHHIDENPDNHEIDNLAVLCLECHDETQITGGFGRKLDATQIKLFRDKWHEFVAKQRDAKTLTSPKINVSSGSKKVEDRPIRVEVTFCSYNYETGNPIAGYMFTAKNFGDRPVILSGLYIELPKGMQLFYAVPMYQGTLPYKLEPGDSFFTVWDISDLKRHIEGSEFRGLKKTRAYYVDKLGERHYSDPFSLE